LSKIRLAIFDLDHTLVSTNISFAFGKFLFFKGMMPLSCMLRSSAAYFSHKILGTSLETVHNQILKAYLNRLPKEVLTSLSAEFIESKLKDLLDPKVYDEMQKASHGGALISLCTSSPDFLVSLIASKLSIDLWCASRYKFDNSGFLCKIDPIVNGPEKASFIQRVLDKELIAKEEVAAYSDSYLDLPMFELSGHPVAVNPDRKLKQHSLLKSWRVLNT
jgi:HAD superfamily hydrolase (TIGR01490 family)